MLAEFTFEKPSETPYILMPFIFEPGRESLFRITLLSDDRDDDGEPDFFFQVRAPPEHPLMMMMTDDDDEVWLIATDCH